MSEDQKPAAQTARPKYGIAVCVDCDLVRPEHIGPELDIEEYGQCPECGAPTFGLLGTETMRDD